MNDSHLNTQRYDDKESMQMRQYKQNHKKRNSIKGARDSFQQNEVKQVKSNENLQIVEASNDRVKESNGKSIIPEENEEFFSPSPHASSSKKMSFNKKRHNFNASKKSFH